MPLRFARRGRRRSSATRCCERRSSAREWREPLQVVERRAELPWAEEDWSGGEHRRSRRLEGLLAPIASVASTSGVAPLNRVTLVRLADDEHRLVWSTHHLYVDGWSWPLIFRDVGAAYEALSTETATGSPRPPYGAYIDWLAARHPIPASSGRTASRASRRRRRCPSSRRRVADVERRHPRGRPAVDASTTAALQALARAPGDAQHGRPGSLGHPPRPSERAGRRRLRRGVLRPSGGAAGRRDARRAVREQPAGARAARRRPAHRRLVRGAARAQPRDRPAPVRVALRTSRPGPAFRGGCACSTAWSSSRTTSGARPCAVGGGRRRAVGRAGGDELSLDAHRDAGRRDQPASCSASDVFGVDSLETLLDGLATVLSSGSPGAATVARRDRGLLPAATRGRLQPRRRRRERAGDVRGARQRDGAHGRRGLGGAVPGRSGRHGRQLLRPRRPLDPAGPGPRAASRATRPDLSDRRAAPVPDRAVARAVSRRRRDVEQRRSMPSRDRADDCSARRSPGSAASRGRGSRCPTRTRTTPTRASRSSASPAASPARARRRVLANLVEGRETLSHFADDELDPARPRRWRRADSPTTCAPAASSRTSSCSTRRSSASRRARPRCSTRSSASSWRRRGRRSRTRATTREPSPAPIGVFAGMSNNTTSSRTCSAREDVTDIVGWLTTMMGNEKDYLATRVSYKLDLRGPALNIQTACSTSLVAVCTAVQSLLNYQCDMALAGGVSITLPQKRGYLYQEGGITSPDGHCRAFDEHAAGTVFSNGVGIVVLRRLRDALEDGDTIYAVIKGVGHQQRRRGEGQLHGAERRRARRRHRDGAGSRRDRSADDLLRRGARHRDAARRPDRDRRADAGVPRRRSDRNRLLRDRLGQDQHRPSRRRRRRRRPDQDGARAAPQTLPPSLHFTAPNPKLDLEDSPFRSSRPLRPWESPDGLPRRAGVSSFGVGGTNAHVVLEEAPVATRVRRTTTPSSCSSSRRGRRGPRRRHVEPARPSREHPADAARRRRVHAPDGPTALPASTGRSWRGAPTTPSRGSARPIRARAHRPSAVEDASVAFLFPGQGAQSVGMARGLYDGDPASGPSRRVRGGPAAAARPRPARRALSGAGRRGAGRAAARTDRGHPAGALRHRVRAGAWRGAASGSSPTA